MGCLLTPHQLAEKTILWSWPAVGTAQTKSKSKMSNKRNGRERQGNLCTAWESALAVTHEGVLSPGPKYPKEKKQMCNRVQLVGAGNVAGVVFVEAMWVVRYSCSGRHGR